MILKIFSRKWLLSTVLVVVAMGVMIRLGIWQLDRLEKRRAFNTRVSAQIDQPELDLNAGNLPDDLAQMEYRKVRVVGEYDHAQEIAIRNQYWNDQWGFHLVSPLHIQGSDEWILVDRGWIPGEYSSGDWNQFAEAGVVTVEGVIRASQSKAELGNRSDPTPAPGEAQLKFWNFVNIESLSNQFSGRLAPAYIQQAPDPSWGGMPYRSQPELELTEGPHLGYALQWFTFAVILGIGYLFYIRRQENKLTEEEPPYSSTGNSENKAAINPSPQESPLR